METLIIIAVVGAAVGLAAVCGTIAFFVAKNTVSGEDFNSLRAQIAENKKTSEGLERNRRLSTFLLINGIG